MRPYAYCTAISHPWQVGSRQKAGASALVQLRELNEWNLVSALRRGQALTRAELQGITGLSRPTIGNAVVSLQDRGIVEERIPPATSRQAGRPAALVHLLPAGIAAGVSIDRDSLTVALIDLTGQLRGYRREKIAAATRGNTILARAAHLVAALTTDAGISLDRVIGVGIGVPGPVNVEIGSVDENTTLRRWTGTNIRTALSGELNGAIVLPDNNANLGALGELQYGAGRNAQNLIYVHVGSGVGGALVLDGRLYRGEQGYAGEIGHIRAVPDDRPCPCGKTGCLSTIASVWAISRQINGDDAQASTAQTILQLDRAGDTATQNALHDAGTCTGRVLVSLIDMLNPGLIILGGALGAGSGTFLRAAQSAIESGIQPSHQRGLRVMAAELGDRSEVLGAAARVLSDDNCVHPFITAL